MRAFLFSAAFLFTYSAFAELPKVCYTTVDNTEFCTTDNLGKVQVYIYNAGWCGPCNQEMDEMPDVAAQFAGQNVAFASLSGEGWSRGQKPDVAFLKEWKDRHNVTFTVAGKYRDFGTAFNPPGYIPFSVIVDQQGNVAKSGSMGGSEIADEVRRLLGSF